MNGSQRAPFPTLYKAPPPELELKIGTWAGWGGEGLTETRKDLVEGLKHQGGRLDQCSSSASQAEASGSECVGSENEWPLVLALSSPSPGFWCSCGLGTFEAPSTPFKAHPGPRGGHLLLVPDSLLPSSGS